LPQGIAEYGGKTARRQMDTAPDKEEAAMKNLIMTTVFGIVSVVAAQAFASEIEDYAGLPLYQEDIVAGPQEAVIDENRAGYDGLPVTRGIKPVFQSAEVEYEEGYDGLPLVDTESRGMFAIQE